MPKLLSRRTLVAAAAVLAPAAALAAPRRVRRPPKEYFEVSEVELLVGGLDPAHDGLKVVQISDIHIGSHTPDGRVISAVREINAHKPDLAILTGDYVTWKRDPLEPVPVLLKGIEAPTFVVMGNHDHYSDVVHIRRSLEHIGYTVLQNEHTVTRVRGRPLAVFGIDDGFTHHDDVEKTFKGAPKKGTRLVLAHNPPTANKLPARENLVCFSGHTHGGHVVVPRVTDSIFRRVGQPYIRGLYQVRGNQLYVNRGLGQGGPLGRAGAVPELTIFTLRSA